MNKTETANQLRLAAKLIETEHPWEYSADHFHWSISSGTCPMFALKSEWEIRLALATPPDNRPLHNPDGLSAEQVGLGWRLGLQEESANQPHEYWGGEWLQGTPSTVAFGSFQVACRLPLSVPWPEAKAETTKQVPLGPEDVPPGSILKANSWASHEWRSVSHVYSDGVLLSNCPATAQWSHLMLEYQINRSIPLTGKWDASAWGPCSKEVKA